MSILTHIKALVANRDGHLVKPVVLQFPINDICNSRCQMCHIWKKKIEPYVSPKDIRQHLSAPLFSEIQTVGMNGGEPTLRKDVGEVAQALFDTLPKLKAITLITNAYNVEQVIERVGEVADVVAKAGARLQVMVSLDGYGDVHDVVRGRAGGFNRACQVLDAIKSRPGIAEVTVACTIIKNNVLHLEHLLDFCKQRDLYVKYRLGVPHKRLYTDSIDEPFHLSLEERMHAISFLQGLVAHYEENVQQRYFYRSLIAQMRYGARRAAGCDWKSRGATLTSRGEVLYCAVESPAVANLGDDDIESRYFAAEPELDAIKANKCDNCRHDYMGLANPVDQLLLDLEKTAEKLGVKDNARALFQRSGVKELRAARHFRQLQKQLADGTPNASALKDELHRPFIICGWYGTETLGDKAILGSVVSALRAVAPERPIRIASLHPDFSEITNRQMPELADVQIGTLNDCIASAATSEAVIFGGGPLMGIDEILSIQRLFSVAKKAGRPCIIAGCGVGPVGKPRYRNVIRDILQMSDLRIFRDLPSRAFATEMGVEAAADIVTEDPAAAWIRANRKPKVSVSRPTLVLGLRAFPAHQYAPELSLKSAQKMQDSADVAILQALSGLCREQPALSILPLPMCTNFIGDDDRWYYRSLIQRSPEVAQRVDWSLIGRELTPIDYLRRFESADAVLSMRFHALVFALQCEVPVVALDYTLGKGKVAALAQRRGIACQNLAHIDADLLQSDLAKALGNSHSNAETSEENFDSIFQQSLRNLLSRVGERKPQSDDA